MKYDLLYTVGDSFTKYVPGKVPFEKQWPALLGKLIGCDVANDGIWCGSNQRSFRMLADHIATTNSDRVLYLVQLTMPFRFEFPGDGSFKDDENGLYANGWVRTNMRTNEEQRSSSNPSEWSYTLNQEDIDVATQMMEAKFLRYTDEVEQQEILSQIASFEGLLHGKTRYYTHYGLNQELMMYIDQVMPDIPWLVVNSRNNQQPRCHPSAINGHYFFTSTYGDEFDCVDFHPGIIGNRQIANSIFSTLNTKGILL